MKPLPPPLSPKEIALLQAMKKSALAYLVMQRLGHATGAREIAAILGLHEQTAARYLHRLEALNLVKRCRRKQGYVLVDSGKLASVAINTLTNSIPVEHVTAQISQNPTDTAHFSQHPAGVWGFAAGDSHASSLSRAPTTEDFSQNLQDNTHFQQDLVWAWGGIRADSDAGILARTTNTTNFSQYLQNTTKFSQYRKKRGYFGEKCAPLPGIPLQNNGPPNAPEDRCTAPLGSIPTRFETGDPGDFFSQSAPRRRWNRQSPPERNITDHLADDMCLDHSSNWVSRAWEDP